MSKSPDWETLTDAQLQEIYKAGLEAMHWKSILEKTEDTPITELLRGEEMLNYDSEYPRDTVQDHETGSQYYFHCHSDRPEEYGHFHTYVVSSGIPNKIRAVKPALNGEHANDRRTHAHLVAIVTNGRGEPENLFTINHWSAQEACYSADDMVKILDRFDVTHAVPSYPLNRWVSAVMRLFRPQIIQLFIEREATIESFQQANPDTPAMANEALEVTSNAEISVSTQLNAAGTELAQRGLPLPVFHG